MGPVLGLDEVARGCDWVGGHLEVLACVGVFARVCACYVRACVPAYLHACARD